MEKVTEMGKCGIDSVYGASIKNIINDTIGCKLDESKLFYSLNQGSFSVPEVSEHCSEMRITGSFEVKCDQSYLLPKLEEIVSSVEVVNVTLKDLSECDDNLGERDLLCLVFCVALSTLNCQIAYH